MMHLSQSNHCDVKSATQIHSKDEASPNGWKLGRHKLKANYKNPIHWCGMLSRPYGSGLCEHSALENCRLHAAWPVLQSRTRDARRCTWQTPK